MNINSLSQNQKCTCSKSGCRKKYCVCYSNERPCQECGCQNCENRPKKSEQNLEKSNNKNSNISIHNYNNDKNQRLSCNCTKSNCMKKYCECYKQGIKCNSFCRCILCNNYDNNKNNISNENTNNILENKNNNNNNYINKNNITNLSKSQNFSTYHFHEQLISKIKDFKNPIKFQFEAFEVYLKKGKIKIDKRNINEIKNLEDDKKMNLIKLQNSRKKKEQEMKKIIQI